MQNANSKLLEDAIAAVRAAGNPFVGRPNTESVRQQVEAAFANALSALSQRGYEPHIEIRVDGKTNAVIASIMPSDEMLYDLIRGGLLCTSCESLKTRKVDVENMEEATQVMNAGYYPEYCRICEDCGEYLEVKK